MRRRCGRPVSLLCNLKHSPLTCRRYKIIHCRLWWHYWWKNIWCRDRRVGCFASFQHIHILRLASYQQNSSNVSFDQNNKYMVILQSVISHTYYHHWSLTVTCFTTCDFYWIFVLHSYQLHWDYFNSKDVRTSECVQVCTHGHICIYNYFLQFKHRQPLETGNLRHLEHNTIL